MGKINLVIESSYENVELVGLCIESLTAQLFAEEQTHQIKTCVYEAVTNCIKHGYHGLPGYQVQVSYQIGEDRLILDISDCGASMNPAVLQQTSTRFQFDTDNPKEGGMGLKIIKAWMDDISYQVRDGVNHFQMVKYFAPKEPFATAQA